MEPEVSGKPFGKGLFNGLSADVPVARPARAPPLVAAAGDGQADEYESAR
jgi:hypothetical protein